MAQFGHVAKWLKEQGVDVGEKDLPCHTTGVFYVEETLVFYPQPTGTLASEAIR